MLHFYFFRFLTRSTGLVSVLLALCITANPLAAQKKIVLTSYNSTITDVTVTSSYPDANWYGEPHIWAYAWTQGGIETIIRPLLHFDLSSVPAGATVEEALLILHYDPTTTPSGWTHSGNTDFYIRRITEPWDESTVVWNNQPATTAKNEILVPSFGYDRQNYVVNVTELVKDMLSAGANNYGFMFQLLSETSYNMARIAGSHHADLSRRPQLWLSVDDNVSGTDEQKTKGEPTHFQVGPNPTAGELFLSADSVPTGVNTAEIYDPEGKLVLQETLAGSYSSLYLNQLPDGVYILKIRNADAGYIQVEKIVLAK